MLNYVNPAGHHRAIDCVASPMRSVIASLAFCLVTTIGLAAPRDVNQSFGLKDSTVISLDLPVVAGSAVSIEVPVNGIHSTLTLYPQSVRAPGFEVRLELADGSFMPVEPGPVRTLRGHVEGIDGSSAAGLLADEGLYARIFLPDGSQHWIEPLAGSVAGAGPNDHVIYRGADVVPSGGECELLDERHAMAQQQAIQQDTENGGVAGGAFYLTELVCEADVEYFQDFNSNVQTVQTKIENIINSMNLQYEQEVQISHLITIIIVRTAEPDPYSGTSASGILNQFRNVWTQNPPSDAHHDVAQLFTGRNIVGDNGSSGTIGVAWLGGVCNGQGYSVVENCCSSMACLTDLSAHELGHTWDAAHCSCPGWTMNPSLTCANNFHPTDSIPDIIAFRNTRSCLNFNDPLLRILISGPLEVSEGTTVQYIATAQYQLGDDEIVTAGTVWSVDPPSAGFFNAPGLFTASNVIGDQPVTIVATYTDDTGSDTDMRDITIFDLDAPDPRTVVVEIVPQLELGTLCPGESFTADVLLSAPDGDINNVRLIQFDTALTSGVTIDEFNWSIEELTSDALYLQLVQGSVYTATYIGQSPTPGLILNLNATPKLVAHVQATIIEEGALDLCGHQFPPVTDESVRFSSGFEMIAEFSQALGNVDCGNLIVNPGAGSLELVSSVPPDGAIDARQPSNLDGSNPVGWQSITLTFNCSTSGMTAEDFTLSLDPPGATPTIENVVSNGNEITLNLSSPITPGAWTTFTHVTSGDSVSLGYLPADANGDGTASPIDILALIDQLNGVQNPPLTIWQSDINRSGVTEPSDVLRLIDLLNGADSFAAWNGVTLP